MGRLARIVFYDTRIFEKGNLEAKGNLCLIAGGETIMRTFVHELLDALYNFNLKFPMTRDVIKISIISHEDSFV